MPLNLRLLLSLFILMKITGVSLDNPTQGKLKLKASAFHFPPSLWVKMIDEKNFTVFGLSDDVVKLLERYLNIEFEYVLENKTIASKIGSAQATLHQVQTGEVDLNPYLLSPTHKRFKVAELTFPLFALDYTFIFRSPREGSRLYILLNPFDNTVWLLIILSYGIFIFIWWINGKMEKTVVKKNAKGGKRSERLHYHYTYTLDGTFKLMTAILAFAYGSNLTSHVTVQLHEKMPTSFEELAARTDLKLAAEYHYVLTHKILHASSGPLKVLGDSLRNNSELVTETTEETLGKILKHGYVSPQITSYMRFKIKEDLYKNGGKCRFAYSPIKLDYRPLFVFAMPLNGPYNAMINRKLSHIFETHLVLGYYVKKYVPDVSKCEMNMKPSTKLRPIGIEDLMGGFIVLSTGLLTAFFVFLLENILWFRKKRQSSNSSADQLF